MITDSDFALTGGVLLQSAWNIMERMLKAPLHAIQWAGGVSDGLTSQEKKETVKVEEV